MSPLPCPERERWQPLRTGLVDLFYYDQEEFAFRDGRLLLRGNNGTGKSKVLALTLPFLLDGDLAAHRVEPDADPKKRMEWNLLLGGEHPSEDRLGYTWIEFGRRHAGGEPEFCTLGCGMKAAKGRGITGSWFFVSEQRIGQQLTLVDGAGTALTRDRLEGAVGAAGSVFRTAREYRRAIDEKLFGLGDQRYATLIDLLIKIRAPQLSKRPDERGLSNALTDALPPLDQAMIADVAEAFRALEEDGEALTAMIEARDAATRYLETYRLYARIATRRRAAPLRQAQSTFDRVNRELADAQAAHERALAAREAATSALSELRREQSRLHTRQQALREGPEARSAGELQRAAVEARDAGVRADQARADDERAERRVTERSRRLADAELRRGEADRALSQVLGAAAEHARGAWIDTEFDAITGAIDDVDRGELRGRAAAVIDRRQSSIDRIRTLLAAVAEARRKLAGAREQTAQLTSEHADLADQCAHANAALADTAGRYLRDVREYLAVAQELALHDAAETLAALELWVETIAGSNPFSTALAAAGRAASDELARAETQLASETAEVERLAAELDEAIARLEAGEHDRPPIPYTRAPATRDGRAGAPLWQLVDFRDEVEADARSGLEAALEVAGILDAWVSPDGELLHPESGDVLLSPAASAMPSGARLIDHLRAAVDRADPTASTVTDEAVELVLAAIGVDEGDGAVWVTSEGRFRNGILSGTWQKPAATYIGHGAREAARRARLEALRTERAAVGARLSKLDHARRQLSQRRERLEAELAGEPLDETLRTAHATVTRLEAELASLAARVARALEQEAALDGEARAAELELRTDAHDLRLPERAEELDGVQDALQRLREALAGLWPALVQREHADEARQQAQKDLDAMQAERAEAAARLGTAERDHATFAERYDTLQRTVGAAVAELNRQLSDVANSLRENERRHEQTEATQAEAQREEGRADGVRQELQRELTRATDNRLAATDVLRRFAGTGLVQIAMPAVELPDPAETWGVTIALRLARALEQELEQVDGEDPAWRRAQQRVNDELGVLADALRRHGNNASATLQEEGVIVEVTFSGRTTSLPALVEALSTEVTDRQRLLDEREREILENHLVNEVASSLQELISAAERQLVRTNTELAERPTSTGMQLRLRWVVDHEGPDGLAEARERLLRQSADAWSEEDRVAVGAFLQARIQAVRARDVTGTWSEHLTDALDYRSWHRFTVERRQNGSWRSAAGPSSGGERVLAASVPLFAAASSYYASAANPYAPRLVTLDEAFAGVDDNARAKCLGLLAAFDLDVVMTSEREWGCYPEVPGLAIAQLSRIDGVAAVLVTRWEWDGATRSRVEPARPLVPAPAMRPEGDFDDGPRLWETSTGND